MKPARARPPAPDVVGRASSGAPSPASTAPRTRARAVRATDPTLAMIDDAVASASDAASEAVSAPTRRHGDGRGRKRAAATRAKTSHTRLGARRRRAASSAL